MRPFTKTEKDQLLFDKQELEKEIMRLKGKPYLSEWEYQTLEMDMKKLRYLRRMMYENK